MSIWGLGGRVQGSSDGAKQVNGVIGYQAVLHPNRLRGFGDQPSRRKFESPSLNDMRAKQQTIVSKFMTFFQRKCSLVIEMYESSFYRRKPNWDNIAEFI